MKKSLFLFVLLFVLVACQTPKSVSSDKKRYTNPPEQELYISDAEDNYEDDDLELTPYDGPNELPIYQATNKRTYDLIHTKLDLRFDWAQEKVIGKAELQLKPYFYASDKVTLDAKGFEFHKVALANSNAPLKYSYENDQITIQLGRTYTCQETFTLLIEYTAQPSATGGSAVITSNKGLFFINPKGEDPNKPMQIWTQGETNWNSRWFPTIDSPNERCTQEVYLTVEDRFKTLSNGLLLKSTKNADGTRTDYWKLDKPHAPYLFMIAIGEYAVVEDKWRNIPVQYFVEPEYTADARAIFPYTPEMLEFFSKKLGIDYPWPKYAQIVVRDFVSGAMENTTAVTFGEYVQKHRLELVDERTNEKVVAHEMMHHWFGNLVTCESWSNLTLNEGFANYSEYLWLEHKYGRDEADYHLLDEWQGYFNAAASSVHPLIHFSYNNNEDMFDAHSYNKGGSVLHMLRYYLGDEAFFASLKHYLEKHAYSSVEVHDLRLAFEAVTGEDLNWFFNQWFLSAGHPAMEISYEYNEATRKLSVNTTQTQDPQLMPAIFDLPTAIDIYFENAPKRREPVRVSQRTQTFEFDVPAKPALVLFDPERVLLCECTQSRSEEEWIYQYFNSPSLPHRIEALQFLVNSESDEAPRVFNAGLNDKHWLIRAVSVSYCDFEEEPIRKTIRQMAKTDPHSTVRREAINNLQEWEDEEAALVARYILDRDSVYSVLAAALSALAQTDQEAALQYARKMENTLSEDLLSIITDLYAKQEDPAYMPFFERRIQKVDGFAALSAFGGYQKILEQKDPDQALPALQQMYALATDTAQSLWRRFAAAKCLLDTSNTYLVRAKDTQDTELQARLQARAAELRKQVEAIRDATEDEDLKGIYNKMMGEGFND